MINRSKPQERIGKGVELLSDMMLMKFKPKNTEGARILAKRSNSKKQNTKSQEASRKKQAVQLASSKLKFLCVCSKQSIIIGNQNQVDMVSLDGLSHMFVDTFHYWSLNISLPIEDIQVNQKRQLFALLSFKHIYIYAYSCAKKENLMPRPITNFQLEEQPKFIQFPSEYLLFIFYAKKFDIYSLSDENIPIKRMEKKYAISDKYKLLAVPGAIDQTLNIFFQEPLGRKFGLWCLEVNLLSDNIRFNPPYKIYDIAQQLKKSLFLQNYSKDIVFLNLGQQILAAKKGYIIDSVNISLQFGNSYLKYLPGKQIILHIENSVIEIYSFQINMIALPHKIVLKSIDSIYIGGKDKTMHYIDVVPLFESNFAIFYQQTPNKITTHGEIFYSFYLSYSVPLSVKINKVLDTPIPIEQLLPELLEEKCDILKKIGLSDRDIYLEIWRRSGRNSIKDYQFILATRDYKTIKTQIENKLRKQSMSFKQVYKIEESCLQINKSKLYSEQCNEQIIKDFLTSHLLLRKLSLFKQIQLIRKKKLIEQDKIFCINIQDYYNYKNSDLKSFVIQKITAFTQNGKDTTIQIRVILNHFRFVYRYIYGQLLQQIIKSVKNQILKLLIAIPQILPYDNFQQSTTEVKNQYGSPVLYDGVWKTISQEQWEHSMYMQKIVTIDNREKVDEFIESLWFKRNWLTYHDMISKNNQEIIEASDKNNSNEIFYLFIQQATDQVKDELSLKSTFSYVQEKYDKFPKHLKNRVPLYKKLYDYYILNCKSTNTPEFKFCQFLNLKDYDLFRYFFDLQKIKKNCLLKEIKPLYENIASDGSQIFNESLLSYFQSDISQISHLKCLLNRINNEKKQFHAAHSKMYQILIRAMQIKLRIGSPNDTPIDEVLIYVQNIPISPDNHEMIRQLQMIQKISDESQTFKKMKINMTIREIIQNDEIVLQKFVDYLIQKNEIFSLENVGVILSRTYRIMAEVQSLKQKIYGNINNELSFFIYLTKILQHEEKISVAHYILKDQYLNNFYYMDIKTIQSLVSFMYRWRFSQNNSFVVNSQYIKKLVQLLPQDNNIRLFLQGQLKFALQLSVQNQPIYYPISNQSVYPRVIDLEEIVRFISEEDLVKIDIEKIYESMKDMEELAAKIALEDGGSYIQSPKIQKSQVYQIFISIYINKNLFKGVIPLIKIEISLAAENQNIFSILILIYQLIPELNEQCRHNLSKITSYLYKVPLKLLQIIQNLIVNKFTGLQAISYLQAQLQIVRGQFFNFDGTNNIFNAEFLQNDSADLQSKKILVQNTILHLKKSKPQFLHDFLYDFVFLIFCYQPYNLAVFLKQFQSSKWKLLRSFISHMIQEEIFDQVKILESCRRAFAVILKSLKESTDIIILVKQLQEFSLVEEYQVPKYEQYNQNQKRITKIITAFERKKAKVMGLERSHTHKSKKYILADKQASIKQSLKHPDQHKDKQATEHMFSDSDDDYVKEEEESRSPPLSPSKRKKPIKVHFDAQKQLKQLLRKQEKHKNKASIKKIEDIVAPSNPDGQKRTQGNIQQYFSPNVRAGYDEQILLEAQPIQGEQRQEGKYYIEMETPYTPQYTLATRQFSPSPESHQSAPFLKLPENKKGKQPISQKGNIKHAEVAGDEEFQILAEEEDLKVRNKKSEEEKSEKKVENSRSESLEEQSEYISLLVKKLMKTYNDKSENEPFQINLVLKQKNKYPNAAEFLKKLIKSIYEKSQQNYFKLIIQIAKKFPQAGVNLVNLQIYDKIMKFQVKYGLDLPLIKMLPIQGLFIKSKNHQDLFLYIQNSILKVCNNENIQKISKLISIGFKRNALEQEIILLYVGKMVNDISIEKDQRQQAKGIEKIKGLISRVSTKLLVDRTEGIIQTTKNFDIRKRLVQVFIDVIRMKGNGKDAKQLGQKLK